MSERWYCLDCCQVGRLSRTGRCNTCGGGAVVPERNGWVPPGNDYVGQVRRTGSVFEPLYQWGVAKWQ